MSLLNALFSCFSLGYPSFVSDEIKKNSKIRKKRLALNKKYSDKKRKARHFVKHLSNENEKSFLYAH